MIDRKNRSARAATDELRLAPKLNIGRIGIVSRDYRHTYPNEFRDFSYALPGILDLLDEKGCDAVILSLYSICDGSFDPKLLLASRNSIKVAMLERFSDGKERKAGQKFIYLKAKGRWLEFTLEQAFGSLSKTPKTKVIEFAKGFSSRRVCGNWCILLCGETNGVKYSIKDEMVHDRYGLRKAIPKEVRIILNPAHDRMTRFEMERKRQYLSKKGRWLISVWNKGKEFKDGRTRDGKDPAWQVFHNGKKDDRVTPIENNLGVEIGILDISMKRTGERSVGGR